MEPWLVNPSAAAAENSAGPAPSPATSSPTCIGQRLLDNFEDVRLVRVECVRTARSCRARPRVAQRLPPRCSLKTVGTTGPFDQAPILSENRGTPWVAKWQPCA